MLNGYPPWYRKTIRTRGNVDFDFPIWSKNDVSRGGWIVAVGLGNTRWNGQKPIPVYRCENELPKPGF
jgi:hypothetical protein